MSKRRREKQLESVNLLDIAPVRLAAWEDVAGLIVIHRPRPGRGGWRGLLDRVLYHLSARRIRLDTIGSFAWRRLDGRTTVRDVAAALRSTFGDAVEPAEGRVGRMVQVLRREGLIAYPGWDDEAGGVRRSAHLRF